MCVDELAGVEAAAEFGAALAVPVEVAPVGSAVVVAVVARAAAARVVDAEASVAPVGVAAVDAAAAGESALHAGAQELDFVVGLQPAFRPRSPEAYAYQTA